MSRFTLWGWFVLGTVLDLTLTVGALILTPASEANGLVGGVLETYGFAGLFALKFLGIILAGLILALKTERSFRVMLIATGITFGVVLLNSVQVIRYSI